MASPVPANSHPLHNFPLPSLWSTNHHRARRNPASSPPPHSAPRRLSPSASASESEPETRKIFPDDPTVQIRPPLPPPPPPAPPSSDRKICVKIRGIDQSEAREAEGEDEEREKTWNLRPRKPIRKKSGNFNGGGVKASPENKAAPEAEKKEKKQSFSISLSRREIEEDIYAMTGLKPARRPKKRPRTVQKQLDDIFPGMWLGLITPDCYKVDEAPEK